MPGALGDLVIALHADIAKFTSDMGRAAHISEREWNKVAGHAADAAKAIGAAAAIAGAAAVKMASDFIKAAADLDDMAEKTGASVEELSKLAQQAHISGASMETIETGLVRLSKALHGTDDEAKGAGKALATLGLNAQDLAKLDTATALRVVATELNKYADGSAKTALAVDLFGRSGAQLLPILKDMATEGELNARVTAQQAAEAEELGKSWRRLTNEAIGVGQAIAIDLVPALLKFVKEATEATKATGGLVSGLTALAQVKLFGNNPDEQIKNINAELKELETRRKSVFFSLVPGAGAVSGMRESNLLNALAAARALKALEPGERDNFDAAFGGGMARRQISYQSPTKDEKKAVADTDSAYRSLLKTLQEKLLTDRELTEVTKLQLSLDAMSAKTRASITPEREKELKDLARKVDLMKQTKAENEEFVKHLDAIKGFWKEQAEGQAAAKKPIDDAVVATERLIGQIEAETKALAMSTEQREISAALRELEASGIDKTSDAYMNLATRLGVAIKTREQMKEALAFHKDSANEVTEFWKEAARNMQDSMASFFFDFMQGNLSDLGKNFKRTLDQMVSNMLAAKAATALFGDIGKGGDLGGWLGRGLSALGLGGNYAPVTEMGIPFSGTFATGTDYVPRTGLALVHQGEQIIPANEARTGGNSFVFNITTPNADSFRASKGQIAAEVMNAIRR